MDGPVCDKCFCPLAYHDNNEACSMTSPATQEPCQKCKDQGVVVDAAGRIIPCDCIWGTSPAPPSQRAELLTQEQLEPALFRIKQCAHGNSSWPWVELSRNEAAALLQHIAAMTQRVEAAEAAITEALGCFEAAEREGLSTRIYEQQDQSTGSLFDLLTRRVVFANEALLAYRALPKEPR